MKEDLASRYGSRHALKVPPHVTLVPPVRAAGEIEALREMLPGFAAEIPRPQLELDGFGYFSHARDRVIYVSVKPAMALKELAEKTLEMAGSVLTLPAAGERDFHPHITLAHRDLTAAAFHLAWPAYRDRVFQATAPAAGITLFAHDGTRWQESGYYPFAPGI
jgi:2'-5' RNA ligase